MSAQLSQTLKDSKLSFKYVLEHLYEKDADLVTRMIHELEISKPSKKQMTQEEKDHRKKITDLKKEHVKQFILDMGGEGNVTEKQIKEEKNKYDKQRREAKKVEEPKEAEVVLVKKAEEYEESKVKKVEPGKKAEEPEESEVNKVVPVKKTEVKKAEESDDDFVVESELEEEPVVKPQKKVKKTKKSRKTTDTSSDSE